MTPLLLSKGIFMSAAIMEAGGCLGQTVESPPLQPVLVVHDLAEDEALCYQAEQMIQLARYAGSVALGPGSEAQLGYEASAAYGSLKDAIHAAAQGDKQARHMVEANARADARERIFKAGCVIRTELAIDPHGRLIQHGQLMTDVYLNALRHTGRSSPMIARLRAETYNGVRIDHFRRARMLEQYYFVVISRCPDDMTPDEAADIGFFMDTASVSIQAFTVGADGIPVQESLFVAGRKQLGADRHDAAAVDSLLMQLGVPIGGRSATGMLEIPLLIPKSRMPNGVVDLGPLYDQGFGTFLGQAVERGDYAAHFEHCQQQFAELEPIVQRIVERVLARADTIETPLQATRALDQESQRCLVDQAFADERINPRVFGAEAAGYIEAARALLAQGDLERFMDARMQAQQTARSFACPAETSDENSEGGLAGTSKSTYNAKGDCEFRSKECPVCKKKNVWTKVTSKEITGDCGCRVPKAA